MVDIKNLRDIFESLPENRLELSQHDIVDVDYEYYKNAGKINQEQDNE